MGEIRIDCPGKTHGYPLKADTVPDKSKFDKIYLVHILLQNVETLPFSLYSF